MAQPRVLQQACPAGVIDIDVSQVGNAAFVGMAISTFLSGVVVVQTFSYMQSNNDKWFFRLTVVFMVLMDFAVTIFNNMFVHYFTITHFGNVSKLMPYIERNSFITLELLLGVTVVFMVELFFASHVYLLKRTHWSVPFFIALCALAAYALAIAGGAKQFMDPYLTFDRRSQIDFGLGGSLSALSDIVVTGALLWSFQQSKTGFRKTDSMLQTLFKYTVTRGALVTVFQIVYVAVFLARTDKLEWPAFQLMLSKIYVITMLAMLNSRKSIRANNSGVLTISEIGTSLGDSRAIHDNFIVPMDIAEERPNGSYQLKEYPQGNPAYNHSGSQPTMVYITRIEETHHAV